MCTVNLLLLNLNALKRLPSLPTCFNFAQVELLDALYVLLRQMPHLRRSYSPLTDGMGAGVSGREYNNMAELQAHR